MVGFKHKNTKKIVINSKKTTTLDGKHSDMMCEFNENNNVEKVETEIIPGGLTPQENAILVDSLYFELKEYLSGKYGSAVTNTDYRLIWNNVNDKNYSLTIFSLDYEIPEEEISIYINDETGETDTINNPPTVKYIVKHLE